MPELPEVETVARSLRPRLVGRTITAVETSGLALRVPLDPERLARACGGARVEGIERLGKYLLVHLSSHEVLLAHLGMSGRFVLASQEAPRPAHLHVRLELADEGEELRYIDPRRFGMIVVYPAGEVGQAPELAVLGPDPLAERFTPGYLLGALRGSRRDIKQFLLDQSQVAGLGNIYVCEALFRARVSPRRRAHTLGSKRVERLHGAIREVLEQALAHRGTTFRDYVDGAGESGGNQFHLDVYGREGEPCTACGARVVRLVQGARSTFFCPRCQK
jgi:formamidopyrimidine-DNA glycosylase